MRKIDPIFWLLGLVIWFSGIIIYCGHAFPNDGQIFQVFAGGFGGVTALLGIYVKAKLGVHDEPAPLPPGGKRTATGTVTETAPPQETKL